MSKRENHWYLLGMLADTMGRGFRPRLATMAAVALVVLSMAYLLQTGALLPLLEHPQRTSLVSILGFVVVTAGGLGYGLFRRARIQGAVQKALTAPDVEALVAVVDRSTRGLRRLPDGDAIAAQARALAYAVHGNGPQAFGALGEVSWASRAPLVQAMGLSAEAFTEALCRRDPQRALELAQRARAMASVNPNLPGAARSARHYHTCVGLAEVLLDAPSPGTAAALEEAAADAQAPLLQLIATFALAIAAERAGDGPRASRLRAVLAQAAPHCAPLHADPASAGTRIAAPPGVGAAPSPALQLDSAATASQARIVRQRVLKKVGGLAGMWAALLLLYMLVHLLFATK